MVVSGQLRRHQGELYVLCYSEARAAKDRAIRERFAHLFEQDAEKLRARVAAGRLKKPEKIDQAIGRLLGRYPRVAAYRNCTRLRRAKRKSAGAGRRKRRW